ncbi:MAG: hypothetical protein JWM58_550 [Rhizobium sp.]|nr:hypothetical protein [Rhizobium sp.]
MTSQPRLSIIPGWVVTDIRLRGKDLAVLCVLGRNASTKSGWCCRSQVKMAAELSCARSTVQASLDRLIDIGVVERHVQESASGRDSAHFYRVIYDREPPSGYAFDAWDDGENEENIPADMTESVTPPAGIPAPPAGLGSAPPAGLGSAPINASPFTPPDKRFEREARESFEKAEGDQPTGQQTESRDAIERGFRRWYPTWPSYVSDSEPDARKAWFELTTDERLAAADRRQAYLDATKANGRTKSCSAAVYLRERRWTKLAIRAPEPVKAEIAAPMGKAWMATRFAAFHSPKCAMPKPVIGVQMDLDAGGERAENAQIARNELYAWPKLHQMNEKVRTRDPWRAPADMVALGQEFVSIEIAGVVGQAWKRLHRRMLLPWLPFEPKYAYFPPIDPNEQDLDKAVAKAFWGVKERIEGHVYAAAE